MSWTEKLPRLLLLQGDQGILQGSWFGQQRMKEFIRFAKMFSDWICLWRLNVGSKVRYSWRLINPFHNAHPVLTKCELIYE